MKKLAFLLLSLAFLAGCSKDDEPKVVTSIQIDTPTLSIKIGEDHQFNVTHIPADLPSPAYKWESSNTSVATVSEAGLVKAIGVGDATIKAISVNGILTTSCTLTVKPIDATQLVLNKTAATLLIGENTTLTYTIQPDNTTYKDVEWTTSNAAIATVENGKITAKAEGKTTIQVKMKNSDIKATCEISVNPIPATGIALNKVTLNLLLGQSETLTVTITPSNATSKDVEWTSDNQAVATAVNGEVKTLDAGTANITVKVKNTNISATCKVVVSPIKVTGISLNLASVEIVRGNSNQLVATLNPTNATNKNISWSSSNSSIATVANGLVSGVSVGSATITAKAEDGSFTATCQVGVTPIKVTGITLSAASVILLESETSQLTASVLPSNADNKNVTWTSSNPNVATVSSTGLITALTVGTSDVTCVNADGSVTSKCSVRVVDITSKMALSLSSSITSMPGTFRGSFTSSITNQSSKTITLTKFEIINSGTNSIVTSTVDASKLGDLASNLSRSLSFSVTDVSQPILLFKWYFSYNGKAYTVQSQYK